MRSAFVDLVVVGIFARVQISLRSATLRDLLWEGQKKGGGSGEGRRTVLHPLEGKRECGARDESVIGEMAGFGSSSSRHSQRTNHGGWNQSALSSRLSTSSSTPAIPRLSRRRPRPIPPYVLSSMPSLTYHPHRTAPTHIYSFYNRPPSTNDHPPPSAPPPSPPRNEPQSPFSQDPSPPSHTPQPEPPIDDEPLYVNAKQYYRILKRRVARARLEEVHRLSQKRKVPTHITDS